MTWTVQPKHRQARRGDEPGPVDAQGLSPGMVAAACNADPRFSAATGVETEEAIGELTQTEAFALVLKRISSTNVPARLATMVSAVYACRVEEKRLPKRPARMR